MTYPNARLLLLLPLTALLAGCPPSPPTPSVPFPPAAGTQDIGQLFWLGGNFGGKTLNGPTGWVVLVDNAQASTLVSAQLPTTYTSPRPISLLGYKR